jgi:hypothetical protein
MKTRVCFVLILIAVVGLSVVNIYLSNNLLPNDGQPSSRRSFTSARRNEYNELPSHPERLLEDYSFNQYTYPSLKLPFYIYDNDLNWLNATINGKFIDDTDFHRFKHADDYWMLQAALHHPMRTHDPSKAKLFFVPTLMNVMYELSHSAWKMKVNLQMCVNVTCDNNPQFPRTHRILFKRTNELLRQSPWFQRFNGKDHVIVTSHADSECAYTKPREQYIARYRLRIWQMSKIVFENRFTSLDNGVNRSPEVAANIGGGSDIPALYVAKPCPFIHNKTADFAMVASLHSDIKDIQKKARFQSRRDICNWLSRAANYSVSHCGQGNQCPVLSQARYGFHVKGDTLGANRLQDTILSGTVPIFTHPDQYKVLPNFIPWKALSEFVNVTTFESFTASLDAILSQPPEVYEAKRKLVLQWRDAVDVTTKVPFDLYMSEFATRLGLSNRLSPSYWHN